MTDDGWSGQSHVNNGGRSSDFAPGSNAWNGAREEEQRRAQAARDSQQRFTDSTFSSPRSGGYAGGSSGGGSGLGTVLGIGFILVVGGMVMSHHQAGARSEAASSATAASSVLPAAAPDDPNGATTAQTATVDASAGAASDPNAAQAANTVDLGDPSTSPAIAPAAATETAQAGPSFDCAQAQNDNQRLICTTPDLAEMDRMLASDYHAAMARTANPAGLRSDQRAWIARRDAAPTDVLALTDIYNQRITELRATAAQ